MESTEVWLHNPVCANQVGPKTAQRAIAADWVAAHKKYVGQSRQAVNLRHKRPFEVADNLKRHENPCFVGTPAHVVTMGIPRRNAPAP
jgi:hypothetical protein